jgi:hypothetical protein
LRDFWIDGQLGIPVPSLAETTIALLLRFHHPGLPGIAGGNVSGRPPLFQKKEKNSLKKDKGMRK